MMKNTILGVGVTNETQDSILEHVVNSLQKSAEKYFIVTPNPEILVYAAHHPRFKTILNQAKLALNDGVGLSMAGKFLGKPFKQRVTGVDLMVALCRAVNEKPITVGFLGGGPGVAEKAAECLTAQFLGIKVSFAVSELADLDPKAEKVFSMKYLVSSKRKSTGAQNTKYEIPDTDLLFVAFGFPKQEEWIAENLDKLPVKVAIGVGGAFDYISGTVSRAPVWVQKLGFEWLYRLVVEPWRWKRQLALIEFVFLVIKERFKSK